MRRLGMCMAVLAGLLLVAGTLMEVAGQDAGGRGTGARPQRRRGFDFASQWKDRLGLTADQVKRITDLGTQRQQKMQGADRDARREVTQWYNREVQAVLTAEQRATYETAMQQRREQAQVQRLLGNAALRNIELNDDQRRRLADVQKQRDAKVKAACEAYKAGLKGLLTAEQFATLEQNLAGGGRGGRGGGAGGGGGN